MKFVRYHYDRAKTRIEESTMWKYEDSKVTMIGIETGLYEKDGGKPYTKIKVVTENGKLPKYYIYNRANKVIKIYTIEYSIEGKRKVEKWTYYDKNGNILRVETLNERQMVQDKLEGRLKKQKE